MNADFITLAKMKDSVLIRMVILLVTAMVLVMEVSMITVMEFYDVRLIFA